MRIIPAIDILDGRVVRLRQGDYNAVTVYHEDPVAFATQLREQGIRELHVIDLGGAKLGKPCAEKELRAIAALGLELQVGGGIRSVESAKRYLDAGVMRLILSSAPIKDVELWAKLLCVCGPEQLMLSLDVAGARVRVNGWMEDSGLTLEEAINRVGADQLKQLIVTDTERDGVLAGVNSHLYAGLAARYPQIQLYAAGGIDGPSALQQLASAGLTGAIVGRAFYERPEWLHATSDDLAGELLC